MPYLARVILKLIHTFFFDLLYAGVSSDINCIHTRHPLISNGDFSEDRKPSNSFILDLDLLG